MLKHRCARTCTHCLKNINTKSFPFLYSVRDVFLHVLHCWWGKLLADKCDCICVCVCIERMITCSMWWVIHRMACQGAAGWLVGSSYAGNSSAMHRWAQDSGEIPTSLPDFLVNWYLICSWLQNSCLYMLHAVLVRNQAPHFEMPCDFNSQFYTSLAHLMQWKMNTDGFGQDRKIPTCMPVIQLFPARSVFFPASYYMLNDFELLTVTKTQWLKAWFNLI